MTTPTLPQEFQEQISSKVDAFIASKGAEMLETFKTTSHDEQTRIFEGLKAEVNKAIKENADFSNLAEKQGALELAITAFNNKNTAKESLKAPSFSMNDARQVFAAHYDVSGKDLPESFSDQDVKIAKEYSDLTSMLYGNSNTFKFHEQKFRQENVGSMLATSFDTSAMSPADIEQAQSELGQKINFNLVGAGAYNDPQMLTNLNGCIMRPDNILGFFGASRVSQRDYKFRQEEFTYRRAKFEGAFQCLPDATVSFSINPPIKREVKTMSAMYCIHRDAIESNSALGFDAMIRNGLTESIVNGLSDEIMYGNGSAVDNWLNGVQKMNLAGQGLAAGSFIAPLFLIQAGDMLNIQDKRNVKIYTSGAGATYLRLLRDPHGQPLQDVQYVNGRLTIGQYEVVTVNRSFHTESFGYGTLEPLKTNFVVGDLKQLASVVTYRTPTVARYEGANGSACDVYVARGAFDFVSNCKSAAIQIVSP